MVRPLPEKYRDGRTIKVGYEIRPPYGTWTRVAVREEERDAAGYRVISIRLRLANGQTFYVQPSQRVLSRYQPTA